MLHNDAQPMTHANTSNTSPAKSLQVLLHTCVHQYVYISISLYHIVACMCVYIHKHTHTVLIQGTYALDLLRPSSYAIHTHSTLFSNIHTSVCMCMCVCVCACMYIYRDTYDIGRPAGRWHRQGRPECGSRGHSLRRGVCGPTGVLVRRTHHGINPLSMCICVSAGGPPGSVGGLPI